MNESSLKLAQTIADIRDIFDVGTDPQQDREKAANIIAKNHSTHKSRPRFITAHALIQQFVEHLLNQDKYLEAARILWPESVFNTGPECVRRIWEAVNQYDLVAFIGASGQGKTFTPVVWLILDYMRDPGATTIKCISSTATSADANMQSTMATLWKNACIPLPGDPIHGFIGLDSIERRFGIERIAIPPGGDAKARLRGKCHPFPRDKPHPQFGTHSRVRIFIDEDEAVPVGVWEELDNVQASGGEPGRIKLIRANNPKNRASMSGQKNEPSFGWATCDADIHKTWVSTAGWHVVRLDAADSENVKQKREVFTGFQTYHGFMKLASQSPLPAHYWTYARGMYPPQGVEGSIYSGFILRTGAATFIGRPTPICGIDTALEGGDNCVMTIGRVGPAGGYQPIGAPAITFKANRLVLQAERQIILPKAQSVDMAETLIASCKAFGIEPQCVVIDRTGNGSGVHDYMLAYWSPKVVGIDFGTAATNRYIMKEDTRTCEDQYKGIVAELWFVGAKFSEFERIIFAPGWSTAKLQNQLLGRLSILLPDGRYSVESKKAYMSRTASPSPDEADSFHLFVEAARRQPEWASVAMNADAAPPRREKMPPRTSRAQKVSFIS